MENSIIFQDKIEIEFKGTLDGLTLVSNFILKLPSPISMTSDEYKKHQRNIMDLVNKIYK